MVCMKIMYVIMWSSLNFISLKFELTTIMFLALICQKAQLFFSSHVHVFMELPCLLIMVLMCTVGCD